MAELSAGILLPMKIHNGLCKQIVRRLPVRHLPTGMAERPKAGFGVPAGEWLRDWLEDLLSKPAFGQPGFFEPAVVPGRWINHLARRTEYAAALWTILMFQAWHRGHAAR
ncbi:asparagine synthase-related protein [Sphingomonas sp. GCM10030256]|uniref:asparagine synthase-related protein n=1 Tax=Sphingomonas sp. GCM10030256 TaxID=3273427 RepID=UPI003623D811